MDARIDSVVSTFSISVVISKFCVDVITVVGDDHSVNDAEGESSYSVVNIKSIDEVVSSDV